MKKWSLVSIIFTIILVLAACGGAKESSTHTAAKKSEEKITIKHKYGEAVVKKNPKKVVVFDFGILDTLDELGIDVAGVPQTNIPAYLKKYADKKYTNVGGLKEPDFEAIHELKPDIIFISGRQSALYDQFAEIAPTVYVEIDTANYLKSFEKNMNLVGEIFDKKAEVAKELKNIEADANQLHDQAQKLNEKALVVLANEGKVSAFGPSSRYGLIHDVFGFAPADKQIEASTHGQSISFEYILEKNPDILFVIDRSSAIGGEIGAKKALENDLVKKTSAYKNNKIIYLDADTWYLSGGGLKSFKAMTKEMEGAL